MRTYSTILMAAIVFAAVSPALGQEKVEEKLDDSYAPAAIGRAIRGDWKKIKWETDPAVALNRAKKENKPLMVFLHLKGHNAKDPNPEAC